MLGIYLDLFRVTYGFNPTSSFDVPDRLPATSHLLSGLLVGCGLLFQIEYILSVHGPHRSRLLFSMVDSKTSHRHRGDTIQRNKYREEREVVKRVRKLRLSDSILRRLC
jgi:hypothetical protein